MQRSAATIDNECIGAPMSATTTNDRTSGEETSTRSGDNDVIKCLRYFNVQHNYVVSSTGKHQDHQFHMCGYGHGVPDKRVAATKMIHFSIQLIYLRLMQIDGAASDDGLGLVRGGPQHPRRFRRVLLANEAEGGQVPAFAEAQYSSCL